MNCKRQEKNSRSIGGQPFQASDFPSFSAVKIQLKSADWSLLNGGRRRQLKFGRNLRNGGAQS
jgi:hypothetical protein